MTTMMKSPSRLALRSVLDRLCMSAVALAAMVLFAAPASADERTWDARTLFAEWVGEGVQLSPDDSAVTLQRGRLFEDDGPAAGYSFRPNEEKLGPRIRIRKELLIPDPRADAATLLVGSGGALQAEINGTAVELKAIGKAGNYWTMYAIPPQCLVAGRNVLVLHGTGSIWIARDDEFPQGAEHGKPPNRSARSTDDGATWDDTHLGTAGNVDGEYYVRVFLDHYHTRGSLVSPILDLGNLASGNAKLIGRILAGLGPIRATATCELNTAGEVAIDFRAGMTAVPRAEGWTEWQPLAEGAWAGPRGRYVQVRLRLATSDPQQSPRVSRLSFQKKSPDSESSWTDKLRVLESRNEPIVRTSIPFRYEPFDHPRLKQLRESQRLDEIVAGAATELELICRLAAWSSGRWKRGHLSEAYPAWDALEILKPHPDGTPTGGFCQQYNLVFLQACESFGLVGRAVSLSPGSLVNKPGRSGHEVVEIWSNEYRKWIYVDGDFAKLPVDEVTNIPLSLWELRQRQLDLFAQQPVPATRLVALGETGRQTWSSLEDTVPFAELRLIPRSNFLQQQSPLPLHQGMRGWFWTGLYAWTDDRLPAALLYGHRVTRRGDWEWTLNQAHLTFEPAEFPELRVHVDTETPGFDTFLARVDDAEPKPVVSPFVWTLHAGRNRLEVRSRNIAGREGAASFVVLEKN